MTVGGSMITGIGIVCGVECAISASVPTIKGGSINEASLLRGERFSEIISQNKLPSISLIQSGGADLTQQDKVFNFIKF
jgi:acetyl-CoA carboxylase carboxyltransferase component